MSAPRIKRQFAGDSSQRSIIDFFSSKPLAVDRASARPAPTTASTQTATGSPQLPAYVQANLLSVGMRVRKSIQEGYKTGSQYGSFKLWSDEGTHRPGSSLRPSPHRELVPFCGIHRVGGLAVQPSSSSSSPPPPIPGLDEMPELTMSQESAADWAPPTPDRGPRTRKRALDFEVSAAVDAELVPWSRDALHATKANSPSSSSTGWDGRRVLAARKPRKSIGPAYGLPETGQENVMADDFEDAEFFDVASIWEMETC